LLLSERRLPGAYIDKPLGRSVAQIVAKIWTESISADGPCSARKGQQAVTTLTSFHLFVRGPMSKIVFVSLFGIYVLGDEAELAPSFRGFAVGAAAERWRETLL
jgi:hypothetical protein